MATFAILKNHKTWNWTPSETFPCEKKSHINLRNSEHSNSNLCTAKWLWARIKWSICSLHHIFSRKIIFKILNQGKQKPITSEFVFSEKDRWKGQMFLWLRVNRIINYLILKCEISKIDSMNKRSQDFNSGSRNFQAT